MAITDFAELKQLMLQIERDLLAQAQLRTLLSAADATVAARRQRLRVIKARIKRARAREASSAA
jgi:hypothetical protein